MGEQPILIVEPDAGEALHLQGGLRWAGLTQPMQVAKNSDEAQAYLEGKGEFSDREKHPLPVLTLLDLHLQLKSGLDILALIRANLSLQSMPVVVLTEAGESNDIQRAYKLGANSYLVKPVKWEDLLSLAATYQLKKNRSLRLMLVDDDPDLRTLAIRELKHDFPNLYVEEVGSPDKLQETLGGKSFDLVITDYQLKWNEGLTILRKVKARWPECPVIMFTGTGSEEIAVEAMKAGLDDYILKSPRHFYRLRTAVQTTLANAERREEMKAAEQRFRILFMNAPLGIAIARQGRMIYINSALLRIFNYDEASQVLDQPLADLFSGDCREQVAYKLIQQEQESTSLPRFEATCANRQGDAAVPVEIDLAHINLPDGPAVLAFFADITARKLIEIELQKRAGELSALYNLSRQLVDAGDLETIFKHATRSAVETVKVTFARILVLENDQFQVRAAFPVRLVEGDLDVGKSMPVNSAPLATRALEKNAPLVVKESDSTIDKVEWDFLSSGLAKSVCIAPLRVHAHRLGLLVLGEMRSQGREPFTGDKLRLASSIADQTASALRRVMLFEQTERRLRNMTGLRMIDSAITSSFDLHLSLNEVLRQTREILSVDAASVLVLNPKQNMLEVVAYVGYRNEHIGKIRFRLGEDYAGRAAIERRMVIVTDLDERPFKTAPIANEGFKVYYGMPLFVKGQVKGVLEVMHRSPLHPDDEWLEMLNTLAGQAAIAVDNSELFNNLQRSNFDLVLAYDTTLEGWSHAIDLRDKETEGHSQRVTDLSLLLAQAVGLRDDEMLQVRRGALLHDVGKMGIPDNILLKPGPLTEEEWVIMRRHPVYAYEMLYPIEYLRPALHIPYGHHEKWDGTGYPRGLKGEDIPLPARLFAIVDVYDALLSERSYRKAWPKEQVLEYIAGQAGKHFDPRLVEMFLQLV